VAAHPRTHTPCVGRSVHPPHPLMRREARACALAATLASADQCGPRCGTALTPDATRRHGRGLGAGVDRDDERRHRAAV